MTSLTSPLKNQIFPGEGIFICSWLLHSHYARQIIHKGSSDTAHPLELTDWPWPCCIFLQFICWCRTRSTGLAGGVQLPAGTWAWAQILAGPKEEGSSSNWLQRTVENETHLTCNLAFLFRNVLLDPKLCWRPAPGRPAQSR